MDRDKVYFSNIDDDWMKPSGDWANLIAIPRRWWSIKDWKFINDFLKHHQIYFARRNYG